jgi:hypothetical protein
MNATVNVSGAMSDTGMTAGNTSPAGVTAAAVTASFGLHRHVSRGHYQTGRAGGRKAIRSGCDSKGQKLAQSLARSALFVRIIHFLASFACSTV